MLTALAVLLVVLLTALALGLFVSRRPVVLHHERRPLVRPDDYVPTAHPDLTNPPIEQPERPPERWSTWR